MKIGALIPLFLCVGTLLGATPPPPQEVPQNLYERFTMGGRIPVFSWYLYEPVSAERPTLFTQEDIDHYTQRVHRRECGYYPGNLDNWLYEALDRYPIKGKEVCIIGSVLPFYECVVLAYGGKPTTIDYNPILSADPRITTLTVEEFTREPRQFDLILSISSIEHDGLGRYGDPINPDGDLECMAQAKRYLRKGGHMILAVPVGQDALVWTAHRIYGPLRLPRLLKGWKVIDSFGFSKRDFTHYPLGHHEHQPILYLEPQ